MNDQENLRFSEQRHRQHTVTSCDEFVRSFDHVDNLLWGIRVRGGPLIGSINAHIDRRNSVADMGIMVAREHCGNGYATEAWLAVIAKMRKQRIRKIEAGTMAENHAMCRLAERCDMTEEGRRKGHFMLNGAPVDLVLFGREL